MKVYIGTWTKIRFWSNDSFFTPYNLESIKSNDEVEAVAYNIMSNVVDWNITLLASDLKDIHKTYVRVVNEGHPDFYFMLDSELSQGTLDTGELTIQWSVQIDYKATSYFSGLTLDNIRALNEKWYISHMTADVLDRSTLLSNPNYQYSTVFNDLPDSFFNRTEKPLYNGLSLVTKISQGFKVTISGTPVNNDVNITYSYDTSDTYNYTFNDQVEEWGILDSQALVLYKYQATTGEIFEGAGDLTDVLISAGFNNISATLILVPLNRWQDGKYDYTPGLVTYHLTTRLNSAAFRNVQKITMNMSKFMQVNPSKCYYFSNWNDDSGNPIKNPIVIIDAKDQYKLFDDTPETYPISNRFGLDIMNTSAFYREEVYVEDNSKLTVGMEYNWLVEAAYPDREILTTVATDQLWNLRSSNLIINTLDLPYKSSKFDSFVQGNYGFQDNFQVGINQSNNNIIGKGVSSILSSITGAGTIAGLMSVTGSKVGETINPDYDEVIHFAKQSGRTITRKLESSIAESMRNGQFNKLAFNMKPLPASSLGIAGAAAGAAVGIASSIVNMGQSFRENTNKVNAMNNQMESLKTQAPQYHYPTQYTYLKTNTVYRWLLQLKPEYSDIIKEQLLSFGNNYMSWSLINDNITDLPFFFLQLQSLDTQNMRLYTTLINLNNDNLLEAKKIYEYFAGLLISGTMFIDADKYDASKRLIDYLPDSL